MQQPHDWLRQLHQQQPLHGRPWRGYSLLRLASRLRTPRNSLLPHPEQSGVQLQQRIPRRRFDRIHLSFKVGWCCCTISMPLIAHRKKGSVLATLPFFWTPALLSSTRRSQRRECADSATTLGIRTRLAVSPPQNGRYDYKSRPQNQIKALHVMHQQIPPAAKAVSHQRNNRYPQRGSQQIEHREFLPRHAQDSRQRSRDNSHSEDKSCEQDGDRSISA